MPELPTPRRRRPISYLRSGLYVSRPALPAPDTPVGQVLAERRESLIADLGGEDACSTAQLALVDLAVRQWAHLDSVDAYLFTLPSLVDKRHRRVWPVKLERDRLASHLQALFRDLGLERRARNLDVVAELAALHRKQSEQVAAVVTVPQEQPAAAVEAAPTQDEKPTT